MPAKKTPKPKAPASLTIPPAVKITAKEAEALLPRNPGKYTTILDALKDVKPGQAIKWPFGPGVDVKKLINSLNGAIVHAGVKAPKGHSFYRSVSAANELVVMVKPSRNRGGK